MANRERSCLHDICKDYTCMDCLGFALWILGLIFLLMLIITLSIVTKPMSKRYYHFKQEECVLHNTQLSDCVLNGHKGKQYVYIFYVNSSHCNSQADLEHDATFYFKIKQGCQITNDVGQPLYHKSNGTMTCWPRQSHRPCLHFEHVFDDPNTYWEEDAKHENKALLITTCVSGAIFCVMLFVLFTLLIIGRLNKKKKKYNSIELDELLDDEDEVIGGSVNTSLANTPSHEMDEKESMDRDLELDVKSIVNLTSSKI